MLLNEDEANILVDHMIQRIEELREDIVSSLIDDGEEPYHFEFSTSVFGVDIIFKKESMEERIRRRLAEPVEEEPVSDEEFEKQVLGRLGSKESRAKGEEYQKKMGRLSHEQLHKQYTE